MPKNVCFPRPAIGLLRVSRVGPSGGATLSWLLWALGQSDSTQDGLVVKGWSSIRDMEVQPRPRRLPGRKEEARDLATCVSDTDLIVEAEKVARQLIPWSQKIQEIRIEIADLHHKLNHNWQAHNGHLYLFSYEKLNFQDTIKLCNKSQASIADVQDDDEEVSALPFSLS
ncbi:hypothetical protein Chor_011825 [Crotalus horridus]